MARRPFASRGPFRSVVLVALLPVLAVGSPAAAQTAEPGDTPPVAPADSPPAPADSPPAPPPAAPISDPPPPAPPAPEPPPAVPPPVAPPPVAPAPVDEERVIEERVVEERIVSGAEAERELEEKPDAARADEDEDDGPGLKWVWIVPEVGFSYINLTSFSEENLALVETDKSGAMVGAGAGIRLVFLTLGLKARHHFSMEMWQVMGEAAIHLKVGRIDPFIAFRGGYATIGGFDQAVSNAVGTAEVDVSGFNFGSALGLDVFVGDNVTVGVEAGADFLFLSRPKPALPANLPPAQRAAIEQSPLYQNAGSSVGFGAALAGRLGFHF